MPVTLTFVGDDWAEVRKQMTAALGAGVVFESAAEPEYDEDGTPISPKEVAKPKATRGPNKPKADAPKADEPKSDADKAMDQPNHGHDDADETKAEGLNYETDIKPLVLEIAGRFGRDKVMELLAKFGVTNAGHVPVEDQPALMEDIRLVLEG